MPEITLDIFNDDAFSLSNLTAAVNETDHLPGRLGELGLFEEDGVTTTTIQIEKKGDNLALVGNQPRGGIGQTTAANKRGLVPVNLTHLPQNDYILADKVQNMRAFGKASVVQTVMAEVKSRMDQMARSNDATIEFQRIGAVKGLIVDADGTTPILNTFQLLSVNQQTEAMALSTATTDVLIKVLLAKRKAEKALGGQRVLSWRVMCGAGFFDALISHPKVKVAYERWQEGAFLRNDVRDGFVFAGVIWEEYVGSVGGVDFIGADEAYLIPEGVPGMFITRFGPADYMETVNTRGLPYYAKMERMKMDKGMEIEFQSNPISLCTRPRAVVKLTKA
ncbi:MAG: major capsid protein [Thiomicrospira sp.]|jgi:hypothetical protein|nr:major capsid protein [Thiomicrospira sp.]